MAVIEKPEVTQSIRPTAAAVGRDPIIANILQDAAASACRMAFEEFDEVARRLREMSGDFEDAKILLGITEPANLRATAQTYARIGDTGDVQGFPVERVVRSALSKRLQDVVVLRCCCDIDNPGNHNAFLRKLVSAFDGSIKNEQSDQ